MVTKLWLLFSISVATFFKLGSVNSRSNYKLDGCIDDERQFKTAKRSQAPGDATVLKRFSAITSLFFVVDRKE